ncbi:MAG TPA: CTP-dependent riboflavin kinase [Methanothrix sp.]|nr:CTP-dependent riboflavin kinase [Methanothrix soehngenii]HRW81888.1 CTP-dependent riboflavin kinase [Methanothrix sp.]
MVSNEGKRAKVVEDGVMRPDAEPVDCQCQQTFEDKKAAKIRGKVASGLGEGRNYTSMKGYSSQFSEKLGFLPFPGTLNLKLDEPFAIDDSDPDSIRIEGFIDEGRAFGACICRPVRICGIRGAIVRPERTSYSPSLLELIAPVNLRENLGLSDGDEVVVALE